jgi:hypothetical protein
MRLMVLATKVVKSFDLTLGLVAQGETRMLGHDLGWFKRVGLVGRMKWEGIGGIELVC